MSISHYATGLCIGCLALLASVCGTPPGKGIAGECAQKNRTVTICNLQNDITGVTKPSAKQTGVGGALWVPIRIGDKFIGTPGIGTRQEHEYLVTEINALLEIASSLADRL